MIYALIIQELIVLILNFLTNYLIAFAPVLILLFNINLLRKTYKFKNNVVFLVLSLYGSLLFLKIIFFINNGVNINETTNWMPKWNLKYFIYVLLIKTLFTTIPIIYTNIKLYMIFDHEILKKRWKYFVIGTIGLILYIDFNFSNNYTSHPIIVYGLYLSILGIIPYILLIYYGMGKQLG